MLYSSNEYKKIINEEINEDKDEYLDKYNIISHEIMNRSPSFTEKAKSTPK